ncbi:MAG: hypothetical protein A2359_05095 [Candidatus Moranbacteria bacterium RIFOXYB1_FULL_43_19]|nr:MAG: hypothetical protein A2359_05095 [Candidatus Moranbacteria bacterium RIFOXYB1_FULL_43_19]OGI28823.1 MAG: hypothetical protein A2184_01695 [Candidatus Moranbacteria bacterium RIFOXYA1_FULL_44_7]OGI33627.1 MAG: hypothetical protein A2420_00725 [Candidatus Moranbacteria bacterium RIFOXYC1_FULL_44_13]
MKNSKKRGTFGVGRRLFFTLALFLLVFAAASIIRVQAGNEHSVTGWLWGGGAGPNDGTNTNVGWISANNTNQGGTNNYGLNIPSSDGVITGGNNYVWSENIGWISFNEGDLTGCPTGVCNARRDGDYLRGWARILSIRDAGGNSGGWDGWISLDDKIGNLYAVQISKMLGVGSGSHTYAWSASASGAAELGWIDFGQANFPQNIITLDPPSFDLREFSLPSQPIFVSVRNAAGNPVAGKTVDLSNSNPARFSLGSTSCVTDIRGECPVNSVSASDFTSPALTTIVATCTGCVSDSSSGSIIKTPNCNISCPDSFTIPPDGKWHAYSCSVGGDPECVVGSCSKLNGGSEKINIQKGSVQNTCEAMADTAARYDTAVSQAKAGNATDNTNINVRALGWIETNP